MIITGVFYGTVGRFVMGGLIGLVRGRRQVNAHHPLAGTRAMVKMGPGGIRGSL